LEKKGRSRREKKETRGSMAAVKRIANEVRLQETVLKQEGVHIAPDESNPLVINLYVVAPKEYALPGQGPSESPYKGKRFHVKVTLGENYPHACPEVSICVARPELNLIVTTLISTQTAICLVTLLRRWFSLQGHFITL